MTSNFRQSHGHNSLVHQPAVDNSSSKPRPVKEIRFGRIVAAIWENPTEQGGIRHNVTVCRIYKSGEQWRESQSFARDDLPLVAKVLDRCHTWIYEHTTRSRE